MELGEKIERRMDQLRDYSDERLRCFCVHCGGSTGTRDHVPSKVLLDEPYPENLPSVPACSQCNSSFSLDEEYVACLIECILAGSTDPTRINRMRIRDILKKRPALTSRLQQSLV